MTQHGISPDIAQDIALHCLDQEERPMAFIATFAYDATDPYAVWITFHIAGGDVSWAVARTLLRQGLTEPAGEGDVQLFPTLDEDGLAMVCFDFHSPDGRLLTRARSAELYAFLERTWAVVPPDAEAGMVDVDLMVDELLSDA